MIRGFENNLDEMKAIDYLDSLDKRILMTREEGKLTQMIIDYKKIINKAIEEIKELRYWVVNNKHNENTEEHYLVVDYGMLLGKINSLSILESKEVQDE